MVRNGSLMRVTQSRVVTNDTWPEIRLPIFCWEFTIKAPYATLGLRGELMVEAEGE